MDPGMNQLLKWSIENSSSASADPSSSTDPKAENPTGHSIDAAALNSLLGGPTDADLMKESMAAVSSPHISLENKLVAFDNFEQLIENLDNANNLEVLGLWEPLISLMSNEEPELRRYAAWCLGTAVQNNEKSQSQLCQKGAIPGIVRLAVEDPVEPVRRKAIYALSSAVRNYQPGLDESVKALPKGAAPEGGIDAGDMDAVDRIIGHLREQSERRSA